MLTWLATRHEVVICNSKASSTSGVTQLPLQVPVFMALAHHVDPGAVPASHLVQYKLLWAIMLKCRANMLSPIERILTLKSNMKTAAAKCVGVFCGNVTTQPEKLSRRL